MKFVCEHCPAKFDTARSKASHMKVHSKGVKCPVCNEEVRYLASHVKREHSDDPLVLIETGVADLVAEVRALRTENAKLRTKITGAS